MLDTPSVFDVIAQDDSHQRTASRQALALSHTRVDRHLGRFLRGAVTLEEFEARLAAVEDELAAYVAEASAEVGHEHPEHIAKTLVDHYTQERRWQPRIAFGPQDSTLDPSQIHNTFSDIAGGTPGQWNPDLHTEHNYQQTADKLGITPEQVQQGLGSFYQSGSGGGATADQAAQKSAPSGDAAQGLGAGGPASADIQGTSPLTDIGNAVGQAAGGILPGGGVLPGLAANPGAIGDAASTVGQGAAQLGQGVAQGVGNAASGVANDASQVAQGVGQGVNQLGQGFGQGAQGFWHGLTSSHQAIKEGATSAPQLDPSLVGGAGGGAGSQPGFWDSAPQDSSGGTGTNQGVPPAVEQAMNQMGGGVPGAAQQGQSMLQGLQQGQQGQGGLIPTVERALGLPGGSSSQGQQGQGGFLPTVEHTLEDAVTKPFAAPFNAVKDIGSAIFGAAQDPSEQDDEPSRQVSCPECGGDGKTADGKKCSRCGGKGTVPNFGDSVLDHVAASGNTDLSDKPSPKMDKRKWTPQNVGNPDPGSTQHPNRDKDIVKPIKSQNRSEPGHELTEIGERTTEQEELPAASEENSGFSTKQVPAIPDSAGGTWSGKGNQADPVT